MSEILLSASFEGLVTYQGKKRPPVRKDNSVLIHTFSLYRELGTLKKVGEKLGITRERVRQRLEVGNAVGLFSYQRETPLVLTDEQKKIIDRFMGTEATNVQHLSRLTGIRHNLLYPYIRQGPYARGAAKRLFKNNKKTLVLERLQAECNRIGSTSVGAFLKDKKAWGAYSVFLRHYHGGIDTFRRLCGR
jgi:hypothetical protein